MLTINPKEVPTPLFHSYLVGAVAPRPIAFASTVDKDGNPNLAPFSFFNVFSANPPIVIFSPARSGRTGITKHTHDNIKEVPEVVINMVNYDMVQQVSLASTEYPKGVSEFTKAGFTPISSEKVKPFRVKESPAQLECVVKQVIELGDKGGAGNLVICEVVLIHLDEKILDANKQIDPNKIDLVARLGANWYSRTNGNALFEVEKPLQNLGIGIDSIPDYIRQSNILSANNLGQLGNVEKMPSETEVVEYKKSATIHKLFELYDKNSTLLNEHIHTFAKDLLSKGEVENAWKALLSIKK